MFRKGLIAGAASLSLLSPLALPVVSEASPPQRRPHHHHYRVYFRECNHEPWRVMGSYHNRFDAARQAQVLRARGFEAFVR
ncbi:MAG: hypothetical protein HYX68_22245 [Planctomycetes bacterium]|nr:hypothetical protein [Planctomycetota bacterium]